MIIFNSLFVADKRCSYFMWAIFLAGKTGEKENVQDQCGTYIGEMIL